MIPDVEPGCPISWLQLELHALGELPAAAQARVDAHLAGCPACRERAASLGVHVRPMPALRRPPPRWRFAAAAAPVLLAASALLAVGLLVDDGALWADGPGIRVKSGDGIALTLIRERDGVVVEAPTGFRDGDRFRVLLTCPPGAPVVDVVVVQGEQVAYPLDGPFDCGNRVALPGAFRLTGAEPVWVCAVEGAPGEASGCVGLAPE